MCGHVVDIHDDIHLVSISLADLRTESRCKSLSWESRQAQAMPLQCLLSSWDYEGLQGPGCAEDGSSGEEGLVKTTHGPTLEPVA